MHKVYLERAAERDLKRLSAEDFQRVIYEIDDKAMAVRVMRVRHRREAYC